jgi:peptide chain release factor subunit 1
MLTLNDIHTLAARLKRAEKSVLTVYLDIDQSNQANLNRGFETQLRNMLMPFKDSINDETELKRFELASQRIQNFVGQHSVSARGLVVVFDVYDGFFWSQELKFPVSNRSRWGRGVFVEPLAAAIDEYERVGIVLLDRANLRLFTMCVGELEEHVREAFDHRKVRHTKTVGMNNLGAAGRAQRKADEQVRLNLRQMIERIEPAVVQFSIHRLILAGSPEITAQLNVLLPKRLASQVIGTVHLDINATTAEIAKTAAPIAENFERQTEEALVTDLVTDASKGGPAVTGLAHTLHALNQGRIWQLVYAHSFRAPGSECAECGTLFSPETTSCLTCSSTIQPIENVVERAINRAVDQGVRVEVVRGETAESELINAGGIGALLRTRTATEKVS